MIIGVAKETCPEDRRVALVPGSVPQLTKAGHQVIIEQGAGLTAGYRDEAFAHSGVRIEPDRARLFEQAEALFMVRGPGADPRRCTEDIALLRPHHILVAFLTL